MQTILESEGNVLIITIPGELTDLNSYIKATNGNRLAGNKVKQADTNLIMYRFLEAKAAGLRIQTPIKIHFKWFCKNKRKDPDNVAFAKKAILDGMQKAGVIQNDGRNEIRGFIDDFEIDKDYPRIEIEILEVE